MERLTNANHKEMGFFAYAGPKNPYSVPLTIGELAELPNIKYSPREILEEVFARLAAYEDTGLEPERVVELAQAEKDGRLVVLPCKVGDTVWVMLEDGGPCMARVQGISMSATCEDILLRFGGYPPVSVWGSDIGKTWFLTREEAENGRVH